MPLAAVRYASPASIPADMPRFAALCYPTGSRVPGEVARLESGIYLPSESVPADRRRVGAVQYLPGDTIPADMRRVILGRPGGAAYANAVLALTPLGYWRVNEAVGTTGANTVLDSSGNANQGTPNGGTTFGQIGAAVAEPDGTTDTALLLNGTSGYVSMGDVAAFHVTSGTLSAWFKVPAAATFRALVGNTDMDTDHYGTMLYVDDVGKLRGLVASAVANNRLISAGRYDDGSWHNAALTWDGSNVRLFADGAQVGTTAQTVTIAWNGYSFNIGRAGTTGYFFPGTVDEVSVFGAALTAANIRTLYAAALGR